MIVDPPEGWKYGFPKAVENDESPTDEWFIANGYPQSEVDKGMLKYVRFWYETPEDDNIFKALKRWNEFRQSKNGE